MKKKAMSTNDDTALAANGTNTTASDNDPTKRSTNVKGGVAAVSATAQRLTAAENEDAEALLAGVNWNDVQLQSVEEDFKRRLRVLEDENITFLLSFEGETNKAAAVQPLKATEVNKTGTSKAVPATNNNNSRTGSGSQNKSTTACVEKIIVAIEALQHRIDHVQRWTNESNEFLEQTSNNMLQFESLNNQLEVHFKNAVALQETLGAMMEIVEIPKDNMAVLLKPLNIFPEDEGVQSPEPSASRDRAAKC
ncbi:hypothetical protein ATCC90586_010325 [Pythium insidiosum]|nr:hypothetical protein ATCC90586_010325 [Pythium insidiosum]